MKHSFKTAATAALMLVLALLFTGCQYWKDPATDESPDGVVKVLNAGPYSATLYAGQTIIAGTVTVWNSKDTLYVAYTLSDHWYMTESHVAVATTLSGIPQKNGNPPPGKFPYSSTYNPRVQGDTYAIHLTWAPGTQLYIAAHCVAVQLDAHGHIIQTQTGWAGDKDFPGHNWAKYFNYTVIQPPSGEKKLLLPPDPVTMVPSSSDNSDFQLTLSSVSDGYSVTNGTYRAWCVDMYDYIYPGHTYYPTLMSSYDAQLPDYAQSPNWDKINYIINHKQGTVDDIEAAILYFKGGGDMPTSAYGIAMVDDALANGQGFYPGSGEELAVLCLTPVDQYVQLVFIEVDP